MSESFCVECAHIFILVGMVCVCVCVCFQGRFVSAFVFSSPVHGATLEQARPKPPISLDDEAVENDHHSELESCVCPSDHQ